MRNFASTLVKFSKLSHIQTTIWRPPKIAPPRTAGSAGPFVTPLSTILLNVNNELYKTDIVDRIQFSWRGFKVNGSEMEKIKSTGEEKILTFDAFTFLSPIVKISKEEEEAKEEYFHSFLSQKINYYYIFAIVFLTVLLVDAKPRTFRLVKDLFSRMNESEYEVMQLKQSTV